MNNNKDTLRAEFIEYVSKLTRHIRIDYLRRLQHRREYETPKEDLYQINLLKILDLIDKFQMLNIMGRTRGNLGFALLLNIYLL